VLGKRYRISAKRSRSSGQSGAVLFQKAQPGKKRFCVLIQILSLKEVFRQYQALSRNGS
jgi:hypothetical protein